MAQEVKTGRSEKLSKSNSFPAKTGFPGSLPAKITSPPNVTKPAVKTDYISPPERRLGPHSDALNKPFSCVNASDPVHFQLRKLVGLLVATSKHKPGFSGEFLDEATQLAAQFMSRVVSSLHKLTEVQRHSRPGLADLEMCLLDHGIQSQDLYSEYLQTQNAADSTKSASKRVAHDLDELLREYNASNYTLEKDDASLVFHANEQHEIAGLVPRQATRRDYIPAYLPDLPPDFTFTSTGHYMHTTTDLKQIKLRLAEETRLNESSLYRLIDDDERRWRQALELDLQSSNESDDESVVDQVMSPGVIDKSVVTDIETPDPGENKEHTAEKPESLDSVPQVSDSVETETGSGPVKRFDFVEYARKRKAARERYSLKMEKRRQARKNDVFMRAETVFSPYASAPPSKTDHDFFSNVLDASFKQVIRATRVAEKKKQQQLAQLAAEREKREAEQAEQNGAFEFGFAFNPAANHSDDSDDSDGEGAANARGASPAFEFDFGDAEEADLSLEQANGELEDVTMTETPSAQGQSQPQVSGKAPLKVPAAEISDETSLPDEGQDLGHSDLEDELQHHFELGDAEEDEAENEDDEEMEDAEKETTENLQGADVLAEKDPKSINGPTTHVSWGNLGSEESEEDELEDIE